MGSKTSAVFSKQEHGAQGKSLRGPWRALLWCFCWLSIAAVPFADLAAAACERPERPGIPDGATASRDEMRAGLQRVKIFQQENMRYMQCVEAAFTAARARASASPEASERAIALSRHQELLDAYTAAVSVEEEVAGDFNIELREFNALER